MEAKLILVTLLFLALMFGASLLVGPTHRR